MVEVAISTTLRRTVRCIACYDSGRNKVILFGGYYYGQSFNDTWEYDGSSGKAHNQQRTLTVSSRTGIRPGPRGGDFVWRL